MATATHSRQRRTSRSDDRNDERSPRRRRAGRWIAIALCGIVLLLALLPTIVSRTSLANWAVAMVASDVRGSIHIGSVSLGWFSPLTARRLELRDTQGQPILAAEQIDLEESLLGLLWDRAALAKVHLQSPKLTLVLRSDGSNLEDALAAYLKPSGQSSHTSGGGTGLDLEVADASITLLDTTTKQAWLLHATKANARLPATATEATEVSLAADIAATDFSAATASAASVNALSGASGTSTSVNAPGTPSPDQGKLDVRFTLSATGPASLAAKIERLPLAAVGPIAARWITGARMSGQLHAEINAQWGGASQEIASQGSVRADDLVFAAPALGADRVALRYVELNGAAKGSAASVRLAPTTLRCDLGEARLSGELRPADFTGDNVLLAIAHQPLQSQGQVDLPKLAAMMPGSLHVRQQTQITAGALRWQWEAAPAASGMTYRAALNADQLRAQSMGREIAWQQPLVIEAAAHEIAAQGAASQWVLDHLVAQTDHLQLRAAGNADAAAGELQFDLAQLTQQAGQFLDLSALRLQGRGAAQLKCGRSAGTFTAQLAGRVDDVVAGWSRNADWRSPWVNLGADCQATGDWQTPAKARLDAARITLQTPSDKLEVRLARPVAAALAGPWPLEAEWNGQFATLAPLVAQWLPEGSTAPGGAGRCSLVAELSGTALGVSQLQLVAAPFTLQLPQVRLDEKQLGVSGRGRFDLSSWTVAVEELNAQADEFAAQAKDVRCAFGGPTLQWSGTAAWQAGLARLLHRLGGDGNQAPRGWLTGTVAGQARAQQQADRIDAELAIDGNDVQLTAVDGQRYSEPRLHVDAKASYATADGTVDLQHCTIQSQTIAGGIAGRANLRAAGMPLDLKGQLHYDWNRILAWARPYVGDAIRARGIGDTALQVSGPMTLAAARGETGFAWDAAKVYGFPLGPAKATLRLADGVMALDPLSVEVSGGKALLAPQLRLSPEPMLLAAPRGRLLENVQITPEMCASGLQYIAPPLAGVTEAQGTFSIDLDQFQMPLADWKRMTASGRMTVHSVEIGPGPLIREFAVLAGRAAPGRLKREAVVPFQVVDGRVYHQGLELEFSDLSIRTFGSVGFDQTLAVMAELPVPPKLLAQLGNTPAAAALKNQTLRLPVAGTLDRPKLDQKTLDYYNQQFMQSAVRNVIQDQLGRQLDRLLGPAPSK